MESLESRKKFKDVNKANIFKKFRFSFVAGMLIICQRSQPGFLFIHLMIALIRPGTPVKTYITVITLYVTNDWPHAKTDRNTDSIWLSSG